MRDPASPDQPNAPESSVSMEPADETARIAAVSLPDRRRIDSDVRAFLREPSTPWIVFDQEGRPPSQLAVGEVLTGPRRTLLSDYNYDFFPATAAVDAPSSVSKLEPSSLAVASDLQDDEALLAGSLPMRGVTARLSRRVVGASAVAVAVLSMLSVGVLALRGSSTDKVALQSSLSAPTSQRTFGGAVPAEIPPPDLAARAPIATPLAASPTPARAAPPPRDEAMSKPAAKRWGRLSVAGDARGKDVFMDGKRMLGRGARSFTVMCGTHSIAIGNRADAHDVEVPCNAELVVGK